ncbi:MAG: T9SS type A sorting domain-containing protein [Bacteroidetes bacterium]|nr:T9SS type A sorting domain-containing protein [Bacteroidota bacterium]
MKKIISIIVILQFLANFSVQAQSCHSATGFKNGPGFANWVHCTDDHQVVLGGIYTNPYFAMDGDTVFSPPGAALTTWVAFLDSSFQLIRLMNGISLQNSGGSFTTTTIFDMVVDAQKNIYYTGRHSDDTLVVGLDTVYSDNYAEGFLVRYDSMGIGTLLKSFGSINIGSSFTFDDHGRAIAVDASGNIYVTGTFEGSTFIVNTDTVANGVYVGLNSYAQAFTFSLNPQGQTRWLKACGTPTQDESPIGIAVDLNGNVAIAGQTSADNQVFTFGSFTHLYKDVQFSYQGFVAQYDSLGNERWLYPLEAYYGGGPDIAGYDVAMDENGNTYAMGVVNAWGIFNGDTIETPNYTSSFLVKINPTGQASFVRLGNIDTFYPFPGHIAYREGKVVTIGQAYANQVTFDHLGSVGSTHTFVAVYDTLGVIQWLRGGISNTGGGGDIYFYGVDVDPLGRVHVSGGAGDGTVTVYPYVFNAPSTGAYVLFRFDSIPDNGFTMNVNVNGSDTVACGSFVQLQGIANPSGSLVKFTWWADNDTIALPNFVGPNLNATPKMTTTYIVSAVYNGCVVLDTVVLYVSTLPLDIGTDTVVCSGELIQLNATTYPGAQYSWTPNSGLNNDSISDPVFSGLQTAQYICQLNVNGCISTDSILLQVIPQAQAGFSLSTNQLTVNFVNTSSGYTSFLWNFGDGNLDSINTNPTHSYANDSVWTICLVVSNDCFTDTICQVADLTGVGVGEMSNSNEIVVGNTSTEWIIYQNGNTNYNRYELIDMQGKKILNAEIPNIATTISKENLSPGIYQLICTGPHTRLFRLKIIK